MGGKAASWAHDNRIIAEYRVPGYSDSCSTTGHCPKCGRRVGFAADGTPLVGERYDVLERALLILANRVQSYQGAFCTTICPRCDGEPGKRCDVDTCTLTRGGTPCRDVIREAMLEEARGAVTVQE